MSEYRYRHFTLRTVVLDDLRFPNGSPEPGEPFGPFTVATTDGGWLTEADLVRERPMFMMAASFT